jgi:hypothetical protein
MDGEPKEPIDKTKWQQDLYRVIRRAQIHKSAVGTSLGTTIHTFRAKEDTTRLGALVNSLVNQEVNIDPNMVEVANYIYSLVSQESPDVRAVVLLGSLVHGGAKIRNATGTSKGPDLDWGIITSRPLTFKEGYHSLN